MPHRNLKNTEEGIFDIELKLLLEAVYLKYQHDFRHYSVSSLRRRLTQALDTLDAAVERRTETDKGAVALGQQVHAQVTTLLQTGAGVIIFAELKLAAAA